MAALNKQLLQPGQKIRVLVVDDSVVIRSLVTHMLESDPILEVAGTASNGAVGLKRVAQLEPDVVTLDIEMPEMDGLEMLRHLRRDHPKTRVIMFSTLTERGAAITLEALTLGADDYVAKAANVGSLDLSMARLKDELLPRIHQFFHLPGEGRVSVPAPRIAPIPPLPGERADTRLRALVIGVSTGGPAALQKIMPQLPADFPLPVLVVQHMPPMFTKLLAERLDSACALNVAEASAGAAVEVGRILIAPGDYHMKLEPAGRGARVCLDQAPPLNSCRPSVDALFTSACETYGGNVVALILTGMGQDGLRGAQLLKSHGAFVVSQDEPSSVVWGMPGSVVNAGIADRVLPLEQIVPEILRLTDCRPRTP